MKHNSQWCEKHWSRFRDVDPKTGITPNGLFASIRLMEEFINSPIVTELADKSPEALNKNMLEAKQPVCCRLGEEVMQKIFMQSLLTGHKP